MTTKNELVELAGDKGVDVNASDSKPELVEKLDAAGVSDPKLDEARAEVDAQHDDDAEVGAVDGPVDEPLDAAVRNAEAVDGGEPHLVGGIATAVRTEVQPSSDDAEPAVHGTARPDDGVVRTNSAVEPVAGSLVAGAGAPAGRPSNVDREGREVFPDGVAPTALADYDGPNAPAVQRSGEGYPDAEPADESDGEK